MQYYLSKFLDCGFDEACERVRVAALAQGFGVQMEIDTAAALRDKLGVDARPYRIIGTCMAKLAEAAIQAEPQIGVLMPCNWLVQQHEDGRVEVSAMNPAIMVGATGNEALAPIADEALQRILAALDEL